MAQQWKRVYRTLLTELTEEIHRPGDRLPGEQELALLHRVSRTTIRRALLALSMEGRIRIINGRGSFATHRRIVYEIDANSRLRDTLAAIGVAARQTIKCIDTVVADEELANEFKVPLGLSVLSVSSVLSGNGVPLVFSRRLFPADLVPDFSAEMTGKQSFTQILADHQLGQLYRSSTTVCTRLPMRKESELLAIPLNAPLLDIHGIGCLSDRRTVEWQRASMPGDAVKLKFRSSEFDSIEL